MKNDLIKKKFAGSVYLRELCTILDFFVDCALEIPGLHKNPNMLKYSVKAISESGQMDIATAADLYVQDKLKKSVPPRWQFWGEEGVDNIARIDQGKDFLFITDPIEGTGNFQKGTDDWGSVVALVDIRTGKPVIGIVADPTKGKFYVGVASSGTCVLDSAGNVSAFPKPVAKFTFNNSPHFSSELSDKVERFLKLKKRGTFVDLESGALEAVLYKGSVFFKTSNEMAAVFVIVSELGGKVTDGSGNDWQLGVNSMVCARKRNDYDYLFELYVKSSKSK